MNKHQVCTPQHALVYMADCTLATIIHMAAKHSRGKNEYKRQVGIAQDAINWIQTMNLRHYNTRAREVIEEYNGSVQKWADQFDVRIHDPR